MHIAKLIMSSQIKKQKAETKLAPAHLALLAHGLAKRGNILKFD
jgi:hypothetical protein